MQIPLRTSLDTEAYIRNREWRAARLPGCPLHPAGGCSFARHGSYARVTPRGLRIARWYCPEGHRTFSLLPDFLAARMTGLLTSIEDSITGASTAKSFEAAASALRGPDITLPGAVRWLRRRVRAVRSVLDAVARVGLEMPADCDRGSLLLELRRSLPPQTLGNIPAPLGFRPSRGNSQQGMGPDGGLTAHYRVVAHRIHTPCKSTAINQPPQPHPPPKTCFAFGTRIAACKTAVPSCTFCGSSGSAPIAPCKYWTNVPS